MEVEVTSALMRVVSVAVRVGTETAVVRARVTRAWVVAAWVVAAWEAVAMAKAAKGATAGAVVMGESIGTTLLLLLTH